MLNKLRKIIRGLQLDNFLRKSLRYPILDPSLNSAFSRAKQESESNKIFISGTSRSGSTWLTEILNTLHGSAVLWEPLNSIPPAREGTVDNKKYISQRNNDGNEELKKYIHQLMNLDYLDFHMAKFSSFKALFSADTYITKFCRANRLLPWMAENYPDVKMIVLIRHPCAVVASQLKHGAWDEILNSDTQFPDPGEEYLEDFPEVGRILNDLSYPEEQLAADWALDYLVPMRYGVPDNWLVLNYEEMVADGPKAVEKIFDWMGKEAPTDAFDQLGEASRRVSEDSNVIKGGSPLETWKGRLETNQVNRIIEIVKEFGIDVYGDDLEPNYEKINTMFHHFRSG